MEIIEGYVKAKVRLSRQPSIEFGVEQQKSVAQILQDVRQKGDSAIFDYTLKFENIKPALLEIPRRQITEAYNQVDENLVSALKSAAERIRRFHQEQKDGVWHGVDGAEWGQLVRPLSRVGLYAPGGTAAYPSSLLMIAIPPKVAGVKEIILATPQRDNGAIPPMTLVAADIAGVDRVFGMGGAQAVAAMAYGTESVPRVDKICGPGNQYVVLAKKMVYGTVDIDALQGPSEVLIIADSTAKAAFCAADLLAQAEHDPLAQLALVTTCPELAHEVQQEVKVQLSTLSRQEIASESLKKCIIAIVSSLDEALDLANQYAPEHLELMIKDAESCLDKITNAGCVFVGENSTVPLGDYVVGPSHSLPTGGTAKFSSPLNILDFMKVIDVIKVKPASLKKLGETAITIARAEGLEAHARAIEKRMKG